LRTQRGPQSTPACTLLQPPKLSPPTHPHAHPCTPIHTMHTRTPHALPMHHPCTSHALPCPFHAHLPCTSHAPPVHLPCTSSAHLPCTFPAPPMHPDRDPNLEPDPSRTRRSRPELKLALPLTRCSMTRPSPSARTCKTPRRPAAGTKAVGGSQTRRR